MPRSANEKVLADLRKKIVSGGFDNVEFLPSERRLAEEYQVGRGIIRGALKTLCSEGILYHVPARGLKIKNRTSRRMKRIILRLPVQMTARAYELMGIVSGICDGANELYAEVLLSTPPAKFDLKELRERFNADDIQGIIFLEQLPDIPLPELRNSGIPFVVANLEDDLELPCVRMDYRAAGRMAGQRLFQTGYHRPAVYSGPAGSFIYREILAGFRGAAAEENRIVPEERIIFSTRENPLGDLTGLLSLPPDQRPDAVFTIRDYRAAQIYELCAKLSLRIPEDLAIISYDNITWPDAENAGLTSVSQEVHQIGLQSVRLLRKLFETGCPPETWLISGQLIERRSLNPAPSGKILCRPADPDACIF